MSRATQKKSSGGWADRPASRWHVLTLTALWFASSGFGKSWGKGSPEGRFKGEGQKQDKGRGSLSRPWPTNTAPQSGSGTVWVGVSFHPLGSTRGSVFPLSLRPPHRHRVKAGVYAEFDTHKQRKSLLMKCTAVYKENEHTERKICYAVNNENGIFQGQSKLITN